jgi:uncharacterized membrane protein
MNPQLQAWVPVVLSLFGASIVVVLTAWLNTRTLSAQVDSVRAAVDSVRTEVDSVRAQVESVRAELRSEMKAMEERIGRQLAELELRLSK